MIFTITQHDKVAGTDLPMFSRTGKSTVNQYLQFQNALKSERVVEVE